MTASKITWTKIDEAPALATFVLLPIVEAYTKGSGIEVEISDISLAGRIIANFPEKLTEEQKIPDCLTQLGGMTQTPEANIIKLPNISATIPQLKDALKELHDKGYDIPGYPEEPKDDAEKALQKRFAVVLGSAVNPVLREGNSDRRAAASVKKFAQKNPHKMMQEWPESSSKSQVTHMDGGDFFESEKSTTIQKACDVTIEFVGQDGTDGKVTVLKDKLSLLEGEVIDTSVMNVAALRKFYAEQIEAAKNDGVLLSLHLKATMMKVSDPIMFGHCVSVYFQEALDKHAEALKEIGANVNNGLADVLAKLARLPADKKSRSKRTLLRCIKIVRRLRWSTQEKASPTCMSPIISSSMRPCPMWCVTAVECGILTTSFKIQSPWCPIGVMRPCIKKFLKTRKRTDNLIPRPWAASPTSA